MPDLIAPNEQHEVQRTIDEHPGIDSMDDAERGQIIDITARRLNPGGGTIPWGRKARTNDPNAPALNTDAMTFKRPDGLFELYDVISGVDGSATWDPYGPYRPGENGYWWPPNPVDGSTDGGAGEGGGTPAKDQQQDDRLTALERQVATLTEQLATAVTQGRVICLKASNGKWVRAALDTSDTVLAANGEDAQSFEEYEVLVR